MKIAAALAAIAAALALQTTLASLVIRGTAALDLVLIVVVYLALISGPVTGLLLGSAAGLIQDALSSGIIGIGGLAKTVVGLCRRLLGTQFIVTAPLSRFVVFVWRRCCTPRCSWGSTRCWTCGSSTRPYAAVLSQAIGNGFLGVVGAQLVELLPGLRDRRRARRTARH